MAGVRFEQVWKLFGDIVAVSDLSLEILDGEFLVLVGPSGCGKTTSLRLLGGLELPSYGGIWIDDRDVTFLPPGRRDAAMVFQSYALYPHMTVYKNLAFGPSVRHEPRAELKQRINEVAGLLGIGDLLDRHPSELSGGQRQRVALGRSLIRRPQLFLLDEPLSNLDAALRVQMRTELVRLHDLLHVTTVYVTHDQIEALTMGDRVAVFDDGRLLQTGPPNELYSRPASLFVAQFIGSPAINLFSGVLASTGPSHVEIRALGRTITVPLGRLREGVVAGVELTIGIRPHDLHWAPEAPSRCAIKVPLSVEVIEHTGPEMFADGSSEQGTRLVARLHRAAPISVGDRIELALDPTDLHMFDAKTGQTVMDGEELRVPERTRAGAHVADLSNNLERSTS